MDDSRREFIKQAGAGLAGLMLVQNLSAKIANESHSPTGTEAMFPGLIPLPASIHRLAAPAFLLDNEVKIDIAHAGPSGAALSDYLTNKCHDRMGLRFAAPHFLRREWWQWIGVEMPQPWHQN